MKQHKRAIILCTQDAFANGVKPAEIKKYLSVRGYDVEIYNTASLSRLGEAKFTRLLPGLSVRKAKLYVLEGLMAIGFKFGTIFARQTNSLVLPTIIKQRSAILYIELHRHKAYDLLICENNLDEGIVLANRVAKKQILDLPAPWAEELFYGNILTEKGYAKFKALEVKIYAACDYVSFHWHSYAEFVRQNKYDGDNFIDLSYGTNPKQKRAKFAVNPRVVFLGYLSGYWVNLPLLTRLCKLYPNIDVYGGPPPPAGLYLNYKGYAPSKDILADYQFGLITISDDKLRRQSFSSKHLEYISYGLPVLTPEWRHDKLLDSSSIHYTTSSFVEQIKHFSSKANWEAKQKAALTSARQLSWEHALKPLDFLDEL